MISGRSIPILLEPSVGDVLSKVEDDKLQRSVKATQNSLSQPLVSEETIKLARRTLRGSPIPAHTSKLARIQDLRFTGNWRRLNCTATVKTIESEKKLLTCR